MENVNNEDLSNKNQKQWGIETKDPNKSSTYYLTEKDLNDRLKQRQDLLNKIKAAKENKETYSEHEKELDKMFDPYYEHQIIRGGKPAEIIAATKQHRERTKNQDNPETELERMPDFAKRFKQNSRKGDMTNFEDNIFQYYLRSGVANKLTDKEMRDYVNLKNNPYINEEEKQRLGYYNYLQKVLKNPDLFGSKSDGYLTPERMRYYRNWASAGRISKERMQELEERAKNQNQISKIGLKNLNDHDQRIYNRFNDFRYDNIEDEEGNPQRVETDEFRDLQSAYNNELKGLPESYSDAFKKSTNYDQYADEIERNKKQWLEGQASRKTDAELEEDFIRDNLINWAKRENKMKEVEVLLNLPVSKIKDMAERNQYLKDVIFDTEKDTKGKIGGN